MKKNLALFFALAILLTGCGWIGGLLTKDVDTNLIIDIPVNIVSGKSASSTAAVMTGYNESKMYYLDDNKDIADHLSKIDEIDLKSLKVTVTGLSGDQVVNTISVSVFGIGELASYSNITPGTGAFTPQVNKTNLETAAKQLLEDQKMEFVVSGDASGEPMTFSVELNFTTLITVSIL